jgi:hypothetical protein
MSNDATAWVQAHPSMMEPELLIQINQKSDWPMLLAGGAPRVKLGAEDKFVYLRQLAVRTKISSGQHGSNQLPSCSVTTGLASAPTYLQQNIAEYDHHQTAALGGWGVNAVEANRLAMRQGHFQGLRNKALFGEQPSNGEGILAATGITTISLPADSFGNQTISTYDNGSMALFVISIFQQLKARTMQLGMPARFSIVGAQQDIGQWEYQGVVQLTSFQRAGAGSDTIAGMIKDILARNGDVVDFGYDDTLIGAGAGGTNAIIFSMPELKKPEGPFSTNEFAKVTPGFNACTVMYADVPAPVEIPTPIPNGGIHVLSEMRATAGWVVRPETITVLSAQH